MYLLTYLPSYLPTKRSQQHKMYPTNPETDNHKTKAENEYKTNKYTSKKGTRNHW